MSLPHLLVDEAIAGVIGYGVALAFAVIKCPVEYQKTFFKEAGHELFIFTLVVLSGAFFQSLFIFAAVAILLNLISYFLPLELKGAAVAEVFVAIYVLVAVKHIYSQARNLVNEHIKKRSKSSHGT